VAAIAYSALAVECRAGDSRLAAVLAELDDADTRAAVTAERALLAELEAQAAAHGVRTLQLETHHALNEAIGLYRTAGYREVPAFNDEPYAHHWFEKSIGA